MTQQKATEGKQPWYKFGEHFCTDNFRINGNSKHVLTAHCTEEWENKVCFFEHYLSLAVYIKGEHG